MQVLEGGLKPVNIPKSTASQVFDTIIADVITKAMCPMLTAMWE